MELGLTGTIISAGSLTGIYAGNSTGTAAFTSTPSNIERVSVREVGDTIEMAYIETSNLAIAVYPPRPLERRVFKIVYSCKEGKWNKSERIYGKILPAQNENYYFE